MMLHLTVSSPQTVAALQGDASKWRYLLTDAIIGVSPRAAGAAAVEEGDMQPAAVAAAAAAERTTAAAETAKAVMDYIVTAWKLRSTALNGRETNGGDAMV
jgi:hypothetical protein